MRVVTLNLNGLRAAQRKGLVAWLSRRQARYCFVAKKCGRMRRIWTKPFATLRGLRGYFVVAEKPGYSGVAIFCRKKPLRVDKKIGHKILDTEGVGCVWILPVVRCFRFNAFRFQRRCVSKLIYEIMDAVYEKLAALSKKANEKAGILLCSDINIAHTEKDIKHWPAI